MFENFNGKIIWSADGISLKELIKAVESDGFPRGQVAVKLDRLFLTKEGLPSISVVQERGIPVFADAKIIEIPSKTIEIAKLHLEYQPWMLNVMAGAGSTGFLPGGIEENLKPDALFQFSELCKAAGTKSCAVTVLTSKTEEFTRCEFGKLPKNAVIFYAKMAINCGFTDIVCSPLEAKIVRNLSDVVGINTPGVRLSESSKDDQSRVMTPAKALENGAIRLVIGRDLSRNGDFAGNFAKIMANIEGRTI